MGFTCEKSVKTHSPSRVLDFAHWVLVRVTTYIGKGRYVKATSSYTLLLIHRTLAVSRHATVTHRYQLFTVERSRDRSLVYISPFQIAIYSFYLLSIPHWPWQYPYFSLELLLLRNLNHHDIAVFPGPPSDVITKLWSMQN